MNSHRLYVDKELGLSRGAHIPVPSTHKVVTSVTKELYRCNKGSDTELRTWSWSLLLHPHPCPDEQEMKHRLLGWNLEQSLSHSGCGDRS